jgi:hypothetical protein
MIRLKRAGASALTALVLTTSIITTHIVPITIVTGVTGITITQAGCGDDENSLGKLNSVLNSTAKAFEAAIDTNGRLYEAGTYGAKGSPGAIVARQRIASVIHTSNESLIQALQIAKGLTKETFEGSKIAILEKLTAASSGLRIGQPTIDLVLQTVATLINQAVAIVQLFNASDVQYMRFAVPKLNHHIRRFERFRELNPVQEVFAE